MMVIKQITEGKFERVLETLRKFGDVETYRVFGLDNLYWQDLVFTKNCNNGSENRLYWFDRKLSNRDSFAIYHEGFMYVSRVVRVPDNLVSKVSSQHVYDYYRVKVKTVPAFEQDNSRGEES